MADSKPTGDPTEPLSQVRLLSALRSGDAAAIHPFLAEISKDRRTSGEGVVDTGAAALHLAVRCATPETVALLLSHRAISPNGVHPPGSGTTPLHLAASLGRADIVNLLLEQENIDDSLVDAHGKSCRDLARNREIIRIIDDSRSFLNANYRSLLHSYILSPLSEPPSPALISLLESPRIKAVDLSWLDNDSGTSLLHEAARRKDLRLIELAVRAGADVFVRNRRGKTAQETAGKDDRVKVFLRQFANHDKTLIPSTVPLTEPPALKGYLNKYTNVAKGYNTRWFVLKNGVLSYFRHQEDETVASRGSISMKNAILKVMEKTRFEISARGQHNSVQKWYMKANHPVEAHRWTEAISKSIEWFKNDTTASSAPSDEGGSRKSMESDSAVSRGSTSLSASGGHHPNPVPPSLRVRKPSRSSKSISSYANTPIDGSPNLSLLQEPPEVLLLKTEAALLLDKDRIVDRGEGVGRRREGEVEEEEEEETSSNDSESRVPPHENFELHGNAIVAQMEITAQVLAKLLSELPPSPSSSSSGQSSSAPAAAAAVDNSNRVGLKQSFGVVQEMINEYTQMVRERDAWWQRHLKKEKQTLHFWEESLMTVVKEGENLEKELKARSRRRGSRIFGPSSASVGVALDGSGTGAGSVGRRRASVLRSVVVPPTPPPLQQQLSPPLNEPETPRPSRLTPPSEEPQFPVPIVEPQPSSSTTFTAPPIPVVSPAPAGVRSPTRSATSDTITASTTAAHDEDDDEDTAVDSEDEFFDAIDSNNIPNLVVPEGLTSPQSASESIVLRKQMVEPYAGYEHLRARLTLSAEERPNTSLWSVLKHSIGKDLTKISLPVSFNEPTSMLQRMAEDMEFSECLDIAATDPDPLRRLAYVAAFGMSNYSSTLGRIAKPFNPMLSETFEYVRLDRKYRYISEQVSHHPPISACWAESPLWHYYGEVDAQNKFLGKSFEIRPTGIAHADLLLPEEKAPNHYPKAMGKGEEGKVIEHYSWKKVTTNISGFIFGSPTIDHYGDMVVTNHRTGDQCILTFKPRAWRAKDAYEISGQVITARGEVAYEIAGRWNSQLIARKVGTGHSGQLHPDLNVSSEPTPSSPSAQPEYILLWRNSEKPPGSPFNLTPFAITLNHCPLETLKPYLCPTDCRLRVDQRAFELGQFEKANDLKTAQEERQRAIRRAREEGKLAPHQPRWFMAETEGDTGERVWSPLRTEENGLEYWAEREKAYLQGGNVRWKGVDDIFVEEPEYIRELMERAY